MKEYYIGSTIKFNTSYNEGHSVGDREYGVLSKYIKKRFSRSEINKIIYEMLEKHPYIENSLWLDLTVWWEDGDKHGCYHHFRFMNDDFEGKYKVQYEDYYKTYGNIAIKYKND